MFSRYTTSLDTTPLGHGERSEPVGLFVAAYKLRDHKTLPAERPRELEERLRWFQHHARPLPIDELDDTEQQAVCWYKPTATEAIARTRALALFLEAHGFLIQVRQTDAPGIAIHADEWQVAAIPTRHLLHALSLRIKLWWGRHIPTFS